MAKQYNRLCDNCNQQYSGYGKHYCPNCWKNKRFEIFKRKYIIIKPRPQLSGDKNPAKKPEVRKILSKLGNRPKNLEHLKRIHKIREELQKYHLPDSSEILTKELAFVLGAVKGDGDIQPNTIRFKVKDKDFAEEFAKNIEQWSGKEPKQSIVKYKNGRSYFLVQLNSVEASHFLKAFNINKIKVASTEIKCSFMRGFTDAEGCVNICSYLYKKRNMIGTQRIISISQKNPKILFFIKKLLASINIKCCVGKTSGMFALRITGKKNLENYYKNIGFSIKRKQNKLEDVLKSYNFGKGRKASNRKFFLSQKELENLYKKEKSCYKIANKLNIGSSTIYRWMTRYNIPRRF